MGMLASIAGCGGCTPWPETATGGLAERHRTEAIAVNRLEHRYDDLIRAGGERYAASRMVDARNWLNRARREIAAELNGDAEISLLSAELAIERAEQDVSQSSQRPRKTSPES